MPAPSESKALDALKTVQTLQPKQLDALITSELGNPVLGMFNTLARSAFPSAPDEVIARQVHLMVLAYLMRREVER